MSDRKLTVKVDAYTRVCLTAVAALLTLLVIGLWSQAGPPMPPAQAAEQFGGDPAALRAAIVDAQKQTTAKLDELIGVLKSGEAKVQVIDNGAGQKEDARGSGGKPK